MLPGIFQLFDQEEDFAGPVIGQLRGVGEGTVAATGDNSMEGADEREERSSAGIGGQLFEDRGCNTCFTV